MFFFIQFLEYICRWTLYLFSVMILSTFGTFILAARGCSYENGWYVSRVFDRIAALVGLNTVCVGMENFDRSKPAIIIMNHQSSLDPLILAKISPPRFTIIMKQSLKYLFPWNLICILSKTYFINRKSRVSAVETLNMTAEHVKNEQASVLIFPEGKRSDGMRILPFKKGAFHIAIKTGFPIQPVVAPSVLEFMDHNELRFNKASLKIQILPQILTVGKTIADIDDLIEKSHNAIKDAFEKTIPKRYLEKKSL